MKYAGGQISYGYMGGPWPDQTLHDPPKQWRISRRTVRLLLTRKGRAADVQSEFECTDDGRVVISLDGRTVIWVPDNEAPETLVEQFEAWWAQVVEPPPPAQTGRRAMRFGDDT